MDKKNVLVTGIGGNVGQGIIRNIRATGYPIKVIGTNVDAFSAGNHLCDAFCKVPYAYADAYITSIQKIISQYQIDLIIPSTDYESYYLASSSEKLNCSLAASPAATIGIYLDKYQSYLHHQKNTIPFATATLPSLYNNDYPDCIFKPRKGRGSRGLHINPSSWSEFDDKEYMVQRLIKGQEITCAFYVDKNQKLHGLITFERELKNGTTNQCAVVDKYDADLRLIILRMMKFAPLKGAANLQAIVDEQGNIIPFEINCRISGTNSIRSRFGFKDVQYTLQEKLYDQLPERVTITKGVAVRVLMDVIYPEQTDFLAIEDNSSDFYLF